MLSRSLTIIAILVLALALVVAAVRAAGQAAPNSIAQPAAALSSTLVLTKTVGLDPNVCAAGSELEAAAGTEVTYCYHVANSGSITLTLHDLEDSQFGSILNGFSYMLVPGAGAFLTQTATITDTTVNTATWRAYNPGPTDLITATAAATVTVPVSEPAIALTKTVGLDATLCAATAEIEVSPATEVTYCYFVRNTGEITLGLHDLKDSHLGSLLSGLAYDLAPGASAFVTETTTITETTVNAATWQAYNFGPTDLITATDTATVTVTSLPQPSINLSKTVSADPAVCGAEDTISVAQGTEVTYCYTVANTGGVTLTLHDLSDSELGPVLDGFSYDLAPGASVSITKTTAISERTVNTATWTAYNPGPSDIVTASATAIVNILPPERPEIVVAPTDLQVIGASSEISRTVIISNRGTTELTWTLSEAAVNCNRAGELAWAAARPLDGTTAAGESSNVVVRFNGSGLPQGNYGGILCITSNDPAAPVTTVTLEMETRRYRLYLGFVAARPAASR